MVTVHPEMSCGSDDISYHHFVCSEYDPDIHHRRSIRLPGYDYSQEGWYFITICTQKWLCLFGEIVQNRMQLNDAGLMVEEWWKKSTDKFPHVQIDEYVVMPNHFHGIISIGVVHHGVGATPCGRPQNHHEPGQSHGNARNGLGRPHGAAPTIGDVVRWFKTMTTNQYIRGVKQNGWKPFFKKLWQRNYYEHVIRDEEELNHYRQYVTDNPANWQTDEENPDATP